MDCRLDVRIAIERDAAGVTENESLGLASKDALQSEGEGRL